MLSRALWLPLAITLAVGCAQKQPVLSPEEVREQECQFVRKNLPGDPDQLTKEYLKRDGAGEFTIVSGWFDHASLCPGHEGGPEVIYVLKKSHAAAARQKKGQATVHVIYQILGTLEPGESQSWHFHKKKKRQSRTFSFVHTAYGWRMRDVHLADGEFLSLETAVGRIPDAQEKQDLLQFGSTAQF